MHLLYEHMESPSARLSVNHRSFVCVKMTTLPTLIVEFKAMWSCWLNKTKIIAFRNHSMHASAVITTITHSGAVALIRVSIINLTKKI